MYIFIVNPVAGNGRARKIYHKIRNEQPFHNVKTIHYFTKYKGHAKTLMRKIEREYSKTNKIKMIIVIGGDGTIHEVTNGMAQFDIPIAFIPGGSGNDFARGCTIPKKPQKVIRNLSQNTRTVIYWIGQFIHKDNHQNFVNCIGFGFDAVVAESANRLRFRSVLNKLRLGTLIYLLALLKELFFFKPFKLTVEFDGKKKEFSNCFLLTINNHAYFGGGMKINPKAQNNRKYFSVLVIDSISKWKVLALFSTVFTGKHLLFKEVKTFEAEKIYIYSNSLIPYQVDGETGITSSAMMQKNPLPIKVRGVS